LKFEGLGSLIRMCEVDFDTKIKLDVDSIRLATKSDWSSLRCAVGEIDYGDRSPGGVLIYLKASMTGHEDSAVLQYKAAHPSFPHESTSNQFYGEDQFESYRRLGREIAIRTFDPVSDETDVVAMARKLRKICSPTLDRLGRFTQLSGRLMDLWAQLGSKPTLQVFGKEYEKLLNAHWPEALSEESFRPVFYVCNQMFQLMENVYLDLALEDKWDHPDNVGWINTFLSWSKSDAMQKTWSMCAVTFGQRFRYFCARRLGFPNPDSG
jgi:hypothetical protein